MNGEPPMPRVLVADDSPIERAALAHFLRKNGFVVVEAENGDAAMLQMKNVSVDLMVLDLNMPHADGFEVLRYLQEHRRNLPVILLSGMELDEIQRKMHRLKEQELPPLLLKPIDPTQLLELMELQLSGRMPDIPPSSLPFDDPDSTSDPASL